MDYQKLLGYNKLMTLSKINMKETKSYDAVFCIKSLLSFTFSTESLSAFVFESNSIDDTEIECQEIEYCSSFPVQRHSRSVCKFVYCGNEYGLIHENNGNLYQLIPGNIEKIPVTKTD